MHKCFLLLAMLLAWQWGIKVRAQQAPWGVSFQVQNLSPDYALQVKRRLFRSDEWEGEAQLGAGFLRRSWTVSGQGSLLYGSGHHRPLLGLMSGPYVMPEVNNSRKRDWFLFVFPHVGYQFTSRQYPIWIRVGAGPSWLDDPVPGQIWVRGAVFEWAAFLQIGYAFGPKP